jgi:Methylene-tetrahydrofolate reductase C terminal
MACPMNCPKNLRNGPCGGVRDNGHCEVKPEMRCVWVEAYRGSQRIPSGVEAMSKVQFAVDQRLKGRSSWLKVVRELHPEAQARAVPAKAAGAPPQPGTAPGQSVSGQSILGQSVSGQSGVSQSGVSQSGVKKGGAS